jgi:hypothetical protein
MLKKAWVYGALLIAGLALMGLSFLFGAESVKAVQGVMMGVGAGLTGVSGANLLMKRYENQHPDVAKQSEIESKDERNVMIRAKARAAAGNVLQWFIIGLAFVMILLDAPLGYTLAAVGVYLAYHVLSAVFMVRYQKQM